MSVFDRFRQGITLLVDSIILLWHTPRLILFPLVAGVTGIAFLVVFLGITFGSMPLQPEGGMLAILLVLYLGLTFLSTFFTAGLVHQTRHALDGGDVSITAGLAGAWSVKRQLFLWSLIAATVGIILNGFQSNDARAGRGIGGLFGVAWTLVTFFVVPIIVFERTGIRELFTRSASTFKSTWGETPIGLGGVQLVSLVVAAPFALLGYLLLSVDPIVGIGLFVAGAAVAFLLAQTLEGVIKTVLYVYATEGTAPSEFDNVDFDDLPGDGDATRATPAGFNPGR